MNYTPRPLFIKYLTNFWRISCIIFWHISPSPLISFLPSMLTFILRQGHSKLPRVALISICHLLFLWFTFFFLVSQVPGLPGSCQEAQFTLSIVSFDTQVFFFLLSPTYLLLLSVSLCQIPEISAMSKTPKLSACSPWRVSWFHVLGLETVLVTSASLWQDSWQKQLIGGKF